MDPWIGYDRFQRTVSAAGPYEPDMWEDNNYDYYEGYADLSQQPDNSISSYSYGGTATGTYERASVWEDNKYGYYGGAAGLSQQSDKSVSYHSYGGTGNPPSYSAYEPLEDDSWSIYRCYEGYLDTDQDQTNYNMYSEPSSGYKKSDNVQRQTDYVCQYFTSRSNSNDNMEVDTGTGSFLTTPMEDEGYGESRFEDRRYIELKTVENARELNIEGLRHHNSIPSTPMETQTTSDDSADLKDISGLNSTSTSGTYDACAVGINNNACTEDEFFEVKNLYKAAAARDKVLKKAWGENNMMDELETDVFVPMNVEENDTSEEVESESDEYGGAEYTDTRVNCDFDCACRGGRSLYITQTERRFKHVSPSLTNTFLRSQLYKKLDEDEACCTLRCCEDWWWADYEKWARKVEDILDD